uniref:Nose resistant-to-fluoxetine protein N-terminal domain-containing protein n=1 Tax=Aceria tosichella TaxID=561515 RepID=A0A6G1S9N3_9ACAR
MIRADKLIQAAPLVVVVLISFAVIAFIKPITETGQSDDHYEHPEGKQRPIALTGQQWHERFTCTGNGSTKAAATPTSRMPLSNVWHSFTNECNRDPNAWRYKYIDELKPSFNYMVKDKTVDERLANLVYTVSLIHFFDPNYFTFNWGDPAKDAENELKVAGPEVDDAKCARELAIMSRLYDDMLDKLAKFKTANETTRAQSTLEERHIRLARVLDSFGRYESGSLDGKILLAGSYDECIGSQLITEDKRQADVEMIKMRFCWAKMDSNRHAHPLLKNRKKFPFEQDKPLWHVAACLPKSCHTKSFHRKETRAIVQRLVNSQLRLPDSIYVHENLQLDSMFCLVDGDSERGRYPISGKLCLLFIAGWTLLCLAATVMNSISRPTSSYSSQETKRDDGEKPTTKDEPKSSRASNNTSLLNCLDLRQSWRDLMSDKQRQANSSAAPLVDLDALNPIRVGFAVFSILSHTAEVIGSISSNAMHLIVQIDTGHFLMGALMSSGVIDGFFVMSGISVTYASLLKLTRQQRNKGAAGRPLNVTTGQQNSGKQALITTTTTSPTSTKTFLSQWFELALNRYLRIIPLHALLFWFRRDVLIHWGEGPLWDPGLNQDTSSGACGQEPWYMPFTFLSAFTPMSRQCLLPSWSFADDIFFALFTPPIIMLLASSKRPKLVIMAMVSLIIATTLASMHHYSTMLPPAVYEWCQMNLQGIGFLFRELNPIYTWPLYRIPAFFVGSLTGYYLFKYEQAAALARQQKQQQQQQQLDKVQSDTKPSLPHKGQPVQATQAASYKWPYWFTGPATQLSYLYFIVHTFLAAAGNDLKGPYPQVVRLFAFNNQTSDRLFWSLASGVLFLQMMTNWCQNSWMRSFSNRAWRTLGKLNFAAIILHWVLLITPV